MEDENLQAVETKALQGPSFQFLSLGKLHESPFNPRRWFNEATMQELIESVRKKGVLTPLLVRPTGTGFRAVKTEIDDRWAVLNPHEVTLSTHATQAEAESVAAITNEKHEGFEIAAGHRRYRAAKEVGLKEVPAVIREMPDAEFMEVITIENLQREDVHPLDEADGYNRLITVCGYDVPGVAARIAKDESYVYRRLKLRDLTEKIQEAFLHDKITLGHAILIARLQPKDQEEAFKAAFDQWGEKELKSVRSLENWIDREIHLDLHSASFSKKDVDLVPGVGPCTTCVKRTGFAPALFPDIKKKDVCTDPSCFKAKVQAFVSIWIEKKSADSDLPPLTLSSEYDHRQTKADGKKPLLRNQYHEIEKKKDRCSSAKEGIIVAGREVGRVMTVCADPECKIHHGSVGRYQEDPKEKARRKAELEKQKMKTITQERILKAVLEKVTSPLTVDEVRIIAGETFIRAWHELRKRIVAAHGLEPGKTQWGGKDFDKPMKGYIANANELELNRFLVELSVAPQVWGGGAVFGENNLAVFAACRNVDVEAIETQVKEEFKAKREKGKKRLLALAKKGKQDKKEKKEPASVKPTKKESHDPATGDCSCCSFHKGMGNKKPGVKVPGASGKCTRPDGPCIGPKEQEEEKPKPGVCRVCGCTERNACEGGCAWVDEEKTLCSSCVDEG